MTPQEYQGAVGMAQHHVRNPDKLPHRELWPISRALLVADRRVAELETQNEDISQRFYEWRQEHAAAILGGSA